VEGDAGVDPDSRGGSCVSTRYIDPLTISSKGIDETWSVKGMLWSRVWR
jgi:hypothetical protein